MSDENNEKEGGYHLTGMYRSWFLEYASYVILERAVPHINDGLKPVQRRILHSMRRLDDGRYNKVANVVGHTMQFHPHGDASIGDALVQLGQKEMLIDCQGNWGNILTGDSAAAPRYIEARLSKFALDVVFNPKTTVWQPSYDGRNQEPITLPVKFPLLLAQGVEGIAVGLSSKILPHNFCELLQACIDYLKGNDFQLYPDFITGGSIDVARYNDGMRGGAVKVRAKIRKEDRRTLVISEIPYGRTTSSVIDSILRAADKGSIKVKRVEDNTAAHVEILVHLPAGVSSDKTIDALFAFTDCEVSISPNSCVIQDEKPRFLSVSQILKHSADRTKDLLRQELEIERGELLDSLHYASLEKLFIEERMYKDKEFENAKDDQDTIKHLRKRLVPFQEILIREVSEEDILRLMDIKIGRIRKFNVDKANERIARMEKRVNEIDKHLGSLVKYTCAWYQYLLDTYGKHYPRRTELRSFETIDATKVAEANEKLYFNKEEGFIGTALKRADFVCNCSSLDDVIVFYRNGLYKVTSIADKKFVGKNVIYVAIFKKNDKRTIYNVCYLDGETKITRYKRFNVTSITRDREYDVTRGTKGSRISYFSANPNGEAEIIKVQLKPVPHLRRQSFEADFSEVKIKGRATAGNLLTKIPVQRITLKTQGESTLGGRKIWFDNDVRRLNVDGRGDFLGEFMGQDKILVVTQNGQFYTTSFDLTNHYEGDIDRIEKFNPEKEWMAVLYDSERDNQLYMKRFQLETAYTRQSFLGDTDGSELMLLTDTRHPRVLVEFGGRDAHREAMIIDADDFTVLRSFRAHGKRVTTFEVSEIKELEPLIIDPEPEEANQDKKLEWPGEIPFDE
ncbi:MAG TPA: DNA gyrase/topoisomerase IV subunit A [Bacteroidaceae bacterium]|nr:DNA gyrase/topoisomerase IV subunit A [Bacteroidaceae bacterium]